MLHTTGEMTRAVSSMVPFDVETKAPPPGVLEGCRAPPDVRRWI